MKTPAPHPIILQVGAGLHAGGVERSIVEMAHYLENQNWPVLVASAGGGLVSDLPSNSQHFKLPLESKNPLRILANAFSLIRLIRKHNIQLLHARSRAPAWAAYLACKWTLTPFITTFHGTHRFRGPLKKFYNSVMVRGAHVIANSAFIKQHITQHYGISADTIAVAPRGIDPDYFSPSAYFSNLEDIDPDLPLLLLPGRISPWKGQEDFLRALHLIKDLAWQAIVIGSAGKKSALLENLRQLAQTLDLAERVQFLPHTQDLRPYYAAATLAFSASTEPEAFGRIAIEAQAMETPVIASGHGGSLETVLPTKTGWLYQPGNYEDLAQKMRSALEKPTLLTQMGVAGRAHVVSNFTVENCCMREFSVYQKLLSA